MCDAWPEGETKTKSITMRYINELKTTLGNDINAGGDCYQVIKTRIYGSMQLTNELLTYGGDWIQKWRTIEGDAIERSWVWV